MERVIYHIDCNAFYASVECLDRPELHRVPLAVAGDPKERSGIILAKNEIAKRYGVKTAETIWQAKRKCPGLVLVPPRHERYQEVSRSVKALFGQYTDQVESFGQDEAWLDVTGSLRYFRAGPLELANSIRERVRREIGITVSVGVSFNKVFAKLGSDFKKPDATTVISRENYQRLVWPLPAQELLFVGRAAAAELTKRYLYTIGDIARFHREELARMLGKGGDTLWLYANGLDCAPVRCPEELEPVKSIGNGMTFRRDLVGEAELKAGILALADEVAARLRAEGVQCRTLQLMIKNTQLRCISRQTALANPTHLQRELVEAAMALLRANWSMTVPVRALTVTAMNLVRDGEACEQLSLMELLSPADIGRRERQERMEAAVCGIRARYGVSSIAMGYAKNEELGIRADWKA
ncbi:MAG: DNA polymerase IV [Clostridia bacterium]